MEDLYHRLEDAGINRDYLRKEVFPDWWEDHLAEVPANRALVEQQISRACGIPIAVLRDPNRKIVVPHSELPDSGDAITTSDDALSRLNDALIDATTEFRRATLTYERAMDQLAASTATIERMLGKTQRKRIRLAHVSEEH